MAGGSADKARFVEEQYARHGQRVFHLCLRLGCGDAAWAEDMTHETFMRLLEKSDSVDATANVGGWLTTVAYRLCLDRAKRERSIWGKVQRMLAVEPQRPTISPERAMLVGEKSRAAMNAIASLTPKERAAVLMRFVDQLDQREIASVMGHSEGYVSKLLSRATRSLREQGWEVSDG